MEADVRHHAKLKKIFNKSHHKRTSKTGLAAVDVEALGEVEHEVARNASAVCLGRLGNNDKKRQKR
jgi:hypothetical protein